MKKLMLLILLASCGPNMNVKQDTVWVCTCEKQKEVKDWVERNIKPANNMSDEEMEDVIEQLYRTGVKLHCSRRQITYELSNGYRTNIKGLEKGEVLMDVY